MAKQNDGAPGVDGVTFEAIEAQGAETLLEQLRDEDGAYLQATPSPEAGDTEGWRQSPRPFDTGDPGSGGARRLKLILEPVPRRTSNRDRLDIGPSGQHMTRSSEWLRQLSNGRHVSSTLTCEPNLTMSGTTDCGKKMAQRVDDADIMHLLKVTLKASGKKGVPQGGVISPLLSNLYLNEVDRMLGASAGGHAQGQVHLHRICEIRRRSGDLDRRL